MMVSLYGVLGARSAPHVNAVSMTTEFGMKGALSRTSMVRSAWGSPTLYPNSSSLQVISPSIARVWIEEQLSRVEPVDLTGLPRPIDSIAIADSGAGLRQVDVPDVLGLLADRNARLTTVLVEETQLDAGCVFGEQREVHARAIPDGTERIGVAGSQAGRRHDDDSFLTAWAGRRAASRRAMDSASGRRSRSSSGTGRASDQFGHSFTVPGMLGRSLTASASSRVAVTTTDLASASRSWARSMTRAAGASARA